MFWDRFYSLCQEHSTTPTSVVRSLDIAVGLTTKWKNGANPNTDVLVKIARYFGVSIDYLMELTDDKQKSLRVISLDEIDNIEGDTMPPDTIVGFTLTGTKAQIDEMETFIKEFGGRYYKSELVEVNDGQKKEQATLTEQPVSEIEQEILSLTADMDEDERNAVLGYAARIIAKHKRED